MRKRGQHRPLRDVPEADDGVTNFLLHAFCSSKFNNLAIALKQGAAISKSPSEVGGRSTLNPQRSDARC
jgi:hypothetical protein